MTIKKPFLLAICAVSLLSLSACGEDWEAVRTSDVFPYGNARTAGSTIMWVQKSMMPAKELKVEEPKLEETKVEEPKLEDVPPAAPRTELTKDEMDDLFRKAQKK